MLVRQLIKSLSKILNKHYRFRLLKNELETVILKNFSYLKLKKKYIYTIIYKETFEYLN